MFKQADVVHFFIGSLKGRSIIPHHFVASPSRSSAVGVFSWCVCKFGCIWDTCKSKADQKWCLCWSWVVVPCEHDSLHLVNFGVLYPVGSRTLPINLIRIEIIGVAFYLICMKHTSQIFLIILLKTSCTCSALLSSDFVEEKHKKK